MNGILVTGPLGRTVAERLLTAGDRDRVLARSSPKASDPAKLSAKVLVGDLEDPASVARHNRAAGSVDTQVRTVDAQSWFRTPL